MPLHEPPSACWIAAEMGDATNADHWIMKADPPRRKRRFFAGFWSRYDLDYVQKAGDTIEIRVLSGKRCRFRVGAFNGSHHSSESGLRDFVVKSRGRPRQRIVFRESHEQMPKAWWDDLEARLDATESNLSKVLTRMR